MLYAIMCQDQPDSADKRATVRDQHIARLKQLAEQGRLVLAGPFPQADCQQPGPTGYSGSLIVAEFDSLALAQAWADADPYVSAGVYQQVTVKPFKQVLP
jgi:uncharacterized protein YciI